MKITIESTDKIVELTTERLNVTIPARVWEGTTESGIPVQVLVTRIAAPRNTNLEQFQKELLEQRAPQAEPQAFPLRMII